MKKVAVVMESWARCFTYAWPSGMLSKIREEDADVNLYIFNSSANWSTDENYNQGEYNIFRLPDFKDYDGIVLDLNNIADSEMREYVIQKAEKSGVPTVIIANEHEGFYSVGIDNYGAIRKMASHLYMHHGCRTFWFIMGPEENYENRQRIRGLQDYMNEQGVPEENYAFYCGSFDYRCGLDGFNSFVSQGKQLPDAVICANDNIAVGALMAAERHGWNAPKDFMITGFDDLDKSRFYEPRISTTSYVREDIGYACMELFMKLWRGELPERYTYTETRAIFWESCGCQSEIEIDVRRHLKEHILYNIDKSTFEEHVLALKNQFMHCTTIQEVIDCIPHCIPSLKCDAMYLVMDDEIRKIQEELPAQADYVPDAEESPFVVEGYPKDMSIVFSYENETIEHSQRRRKTVDGIFPMFNCEEKGVNFLFIPLHFREKCVGYFAIRNAIYLMQQQFLFDIIHALMDALEHLYSQGKLARINQALTMLYNHDSLTMLYNRIGLETYVEKFLEKTRLANVSAVVTYIDLDRLKYINDTYGHEMGDFAIKAAASVIKQNASDDSLAFRLGGDEFLVVSIYEDEGKMKVWCGNMQRELADYGKRHKCPFKMTLSYGYVVTDPNSDESWDSYVKRADNRMYQYKLARKMNRH
jgi:diguanylate cyclase (GGDEF)-like protein